MLVSMFAGAPVLGHQCFFLVMVGGRRCCVAYEFSCSQYLSVIVEFQIVCDNELDGLLCIAG
jgi:hypothetical protein